MNLESLVTPAVVMSALGVAGAAIAKLVTIIQLPHEECKAEKILLRQENDELQKRLDSKEAECKALILELIAQYKLSSKLQGRYENDSTPPR
jgi:hypothetical protein